MTKRRLRIVRPDDPGDTELRIFPRAATPGDVIFDENGTPMLAFEEEHELGPGWVLWYLDESGGVETYFVGGKFDDVDSAIASAKRWLVLTK